MMGIPALTQPKVLIKPSANGYDSKHPDGAGPDPEPGGDSVSGGSLDTLAWTAPNGLADGQTLIISSSTYNFDTPDKSVHLGFGRGWMYEQEDGEPFQTISVGTEQLSFEDSPESARRSVYSEGGRKYLRSVLNTNTASNANAGFINWDTGSEILPGSRAFMFSTVRCKVREEDVGKSFQWKQERIGSNANLGGERWNECYLKETSPSSGNASDCYEGQTARVYFYSGGARKDGLLTNNAWQWKINTPDLADGQQISLSAKNGQVIRSLPTKSGDPTSPNGVVKSSATERPRYLKVQDYIGNNDNGAVDVEIIRTDFFWQINGSIFVLTDAATLEDSTVFTPLVCDEYGDEWTLHLWKGQLASYAGAYLHKLDSELNSEVAVSL